MSTSFRYGEFKSKCSGCVKNEREGEDGEDGEPHLLEEKNDNLRKEMKHAAK